MDKLPRRSADFRRYLRYVLHPASVEFRHKLDTDSLQLHDVVAFSGIIAHAVDYMWEVAKASGQDVTRIRLVESFDNIHSIQGARYLNYKFKLANLVNNACKHVEIDEKRHKGTEKIYGPLGFRNLKILSGRVFFSAKNHRFDFGRVVLRPICDIFDSVDFQTVGDVLAFIKGEYAIDEVCDPCLGNDDPDTAIDRMIDYCHPLCLDCGEDADDCMCAHYRYPQGSGECNPDYDEDFDFDHVMSQISGAYKP